MTPLIFRAWPSVLWFFVAVVCFCMCVPYNPPAAVALGLVAFLFTGAGYMFARIQMEKNHDSR